MKSVFRIACGVLMCTSCLELDAQNPSGTMSSSGNGSSGTSSGSGSMGGEGGAGGYAGGFGGSGGNGGGSGGSLSFTCDANAPTLLACFSFDGDATDRSGKSNMVTSTNVTFAPGIVGQAASFNGKAQVTIADASAWSLNQVTIELWYYQRSYALDPGRMGLLDIDGRGSMFVYGNGELRCIGGGQYVVSPTAMPLDTWTHAACVHDGVMLSLYINGVLSGTMLAPQLSSAVGSMAIGSNAPSADDFDGLIDGVRVWNVSRSAADICKSSGKQDC